MNNIDKCLVFFKQYKIDLLNFISFIKYEFIDRQSKVKLNDLLYFNLLKFSNDSSYTTTYNLLKINDTPNVTLSAYSKKNISISNNFYKILNYDLCDKINKYLNIKSRILSIDGSHLNFIETNTIETSLDKLYSSLNLSLLYDITNDLPLDLIVNNYDERTNLKLHLHLLNINDILVCDRGYYSKEIIDHLFINDIHFVFRIKSNLIILKKFNSCDHKLICLTTNNKKFYIYRYVINNKQYFIASSLDYSLDNIKNIYHDRWKIETQYRYIKKIFNIDNVKEKTLNTDLSNIYVNFFSHTLCYITKILLEDKNTNIRINYKNLKNIFYNQIFRMLLCDTKLNNNKLKKILNVIKNETYVLKPNRHYQRIRKVPFTVWINTKSVEKIFFQDYKMFNFDDVIT